ncbi:hypothetical protein IMZ48_34880 [Candidatus Bathyarchaeota archaeon]|nr:hypothetical protein [Candidatus Bathyarchaeota archaeon]
MLKKQFRIVRGNFDLAKELIYSDIQPITYALEANIERNPGAVVLELWMRESYIALNFPSGSAGLT